MQGSLKMVQKGSILISDLQETSDILTKKVTAFCTYPKNLPVGKSKSLPCIHCIMWSSYANLF